MSSTRQIPHRSSKIFKWNCKLNYLLKRRIRTKDILPDVKILTWTAPLQVKLKCHIPPRQDHLAPQHLCHPLPTHTRQLINPHLPQHLTSILALITKKHKHVQVLRRRLLIPTGDDFIHDGVLEFGSHESLTKKPEVAELQDIAAAFVVLGWGEDLVEIEP